MSKAKSKKRYIDLWRIFRTKTGTWIEGKDRFRLAHVLEPVQWIGGVLRSKLGPVELRVHTSAGHVYVLCRRGEGWVLPE